MYVVQIRSRLLLVCLAIGVVLSGCNTPSGPSSQSAGSGKKRIVFVTNGNDPFWDTCNAGLKEAAVKLEMEAAGYVVEMDKANFTAEGQIDKLRQYATEPDIVGVAISV